MRLLSIASGSSGNATYVGNSDTHILIDTGVSKKKIVEGLKRLDLSLNDLSAILITHEHTDHICSLKTVLKAADVPVYLTEGTARAIESTQGIQAKNNGFCLIENKSEPFSVGSISITAFPVCHDAREPVCYRLKDDRASCGVVTDLGCFDPFLIDSFKEQDAILMESNHDRRMLEAGPYPYSLKRRIAGSNGHLSNDDAGVFLTQILHDNLKHIILGHLSRKNNYSDLARMTVMDNIDNYNRVYKSKDFRIDVAGDAEVNDILEF